MPGFASRWRSALALSCAGVALIVSVAGSAEAIKPDASASTAMSEARATPALDTLLSKGAHVLRHYPVGKDLDGWLIDFHGYHDVYFTTRSGKYLLLGAVFGSDSQNINADLKSRATAERQAAAQASLADKHPFPDKSSSNDDLAPGSGKPLGSGFNRMMFDRVKAAPSVATGQGRNLWVFYEPVCPHCTLLHDKLKKVHGLHVHFIPVAFLSKESTPIAARILSLKGSGKVQQAFDDLAADISGPSGPSGWLSEYGTVPSDSACVAAVKKNDALMQELGLDGTPGVVWQESSGDVQIMSKNPSLKELQDIADSPPASQ